MRIGLGFNLFTVGRFVQYPVLGTPQSIKIFVECHKLSGFTQKGKLLP